MKICIVLDSLIRAGAERQALAAVTELVRCGYDARLIYYNRAEHNYPIPPEARDRISHFPKHGTYFRFLWRLYRYFRANRFDVVHAFMSATSIYVGVAGWMARVPAVFAGIRVEYEDKGLIRFLHRIINHMVTGWICNSEATRRSLLPGVGASPDRVHVVYNGIAPSAFASSLTPGEAKKKLGLSESTPLVSLVARLSPQKNVSMYLNVAARVLKRRPNVAFIIAGDGELRRELEEQAAGLGIAESVRFLGVRDDIPDVLRATDVLALTSHYEGLANTLLEAMAVGIPVVSTAYAGVEELVTDGREGLIVPLGDVDAFVIATERLLADDALRRQLGECGRASVEQRFTMKAMGARLYSVYESALQRPPIRIEGTRGS